MHYLIMVLQNLNNIPVENNITVELIEYIHGSSFITSLKRTKGNTTITYLKTSCDSIEKEISANIFAQVVHGESVLLLDGSTYALKLGQGIVIPGPNNFSFESRWGEEFKLLLTSIIQ